MTTRLVPNVRPAAWLALLTPLAVCAGGVPTLEEVTVTARHTELIGVADSASEGTVTARQLANRPLLRPAEVMEVVPGLVVTQHSGDGKANQYFLRGFNLDHGSDFATTVMGMPVNERSHAHGQGYMDLNFLIPELVRTVKYRKGPYSAEDGDFATTGAAQIDYQRHLSAPLAQLDAGAHDYRRALVAGSAAVNGFDWLGAVEAAGNDGPWDQPEGLRKHNLVGRFSRGLGSDGFAVTVMAYEARWTATEHVPQRAIDSGEIGRFGALLPDDGGRTHRHSLSAEWAKPDAGGTTQASAYLIDYGLNLFSSPSGFISGAQGDQHEQADRRHTWGGELLRHWALDGWRDSELSTGVQLRRDDIGRVGLYRTVLRQRTETLDEDRIRQTSVAATVELRTAWTGWLRSTIGLRHDVMDAQVTSLIAPPTDGGHVRARQTSPKLGLVFGPFGASEFYANWGRGFHSNDARGATAVDNPVPLLASVRGAEVGARWTPLPGWQSSLSLWTMDSSSELVFVGDEGITEPRGASRRRGVEWSNYITPADGWIVDADAAWSNARFRTPVIGGGSQVPNAIPFTSSVGVTADRGGRWFGGLRWRYLGAYPLEETGAERSTAFWTANLKAGYRVTPQLQVSLDVLNLFDRKANDIEYWGGSCTRRELSANLCGPAATNAEVDGRLVHPLEPRTLRVSLRYTF
jgi:outer membrane receptor protein involved in Fe transport